MFTFRLQNLGFWRPPQTTHSMTCMLGYRWPSTGVKRPFPEKLQKKSEKGFPGPLGPGSKKARKRVENDYFSRFFRVFGSFSTRFWLFLGAMLTLGPRAPGNPFSDFFRSFPGRRLLTPVDGQRYPNMCVPNAAVTPISHMHMVFLLLLNLSFWCFSPPKEGSKRSARRFSDRSFFMDVRAGCPCRNAYFSRI